MGLHCRQVAAELADKLELDGTELVQQALTAGVFDPEQSCERACAPLP